MPLAELNSATLAQIFFPQVSGEMFEWYHNDANWWQIEDSSVQFVWWSEIWASFQSNQNNLYNQKENLADITEGNSENID